MKNQKTKLKIAVMSLIAISSIGFESYAQTLNFDEPFATQSWTEDGHPWSWDNTGWDNIRTYQPHTGTGHGMSAPGYHSKLSTDVNIDIQGIWLLTSFASDFTHLNLKGYNESGSLIYDISLNPMDYEFGYAYVTLNWVGVKSFMVDYNSVDPDFSPVDLFYDDMDYSIGTLSIEDINAKTKINLFPNPSKEFIQITGLNKIENYRIYNIIGTEIKNGVISDNEKIEIINFSNGIYFMKFDNGSTLKFIKK
jgi:hypothetical protein